MSRPPTSGMYTTWLEMRCRSDPPSSGSGGDRRRAEFVFDRGEQTLRCRGVWAVAAEASLLAGSGFTGKAAIAPCLLVVPGGGHAGAPLVDLDQAGFH